MRNTSAGCLTDRIRRAAEKGAADAVCEHGNLDLQQGDLTKAEPLLRQAVGAGNDVAVFNVVALVRNARGDLAEAEALFRDSSARGETDAALHLARLLAARGERAEADAFLRKAAAAGNADTRRMQ